MRHAIFLSSIVFAAALVTPSAQPSAQDGQQRPLLDDYVKANIGPVPASLGYDPFYKKYTNALGIPVVSSEKTPDAALLVARDIVNHMLAKRQDVRDALIAKRWRIGVMAVTEMTTDIPEHRDRKKPSLDSRVLTPGERANYENGIGKMTDKQYWDGRARGLGGNPTTCAEENLLGYPGTRYYGENILVHEFGHAIMGGGIRTADPALFASIETAYADAMAKGKYKGHYAATNANEYWAEGVQWWFWSNYEWFDGTTRLQTPDDLQAYDPALYELLGKVFADHHVPMDVYYAKNIPPRRPGGAAQAANTAAADMGKIPEAKTGPITVYQPERVDKSPTLAEMVAAAQKDPPPAPQAPTRPPGAAPGSGSGAPPNAPPAIVAPVITTPAGSAAVEQTTPGTRPPAALVASFDGLGHGFTGPQGTATFRNPSDNSLAAGPNHIVQIVNSRMAIFSKAGKQFKESGTPLYGPVNTNTVFRGFGGACELRNNGDAVVRYDQVADRWLIVMPVFRRGTPREGEKEGPYSMCYALSVTSDPFGAYYRYEFLRPLFPDYPRPAVWPDGYYNPSSTSDDVIQKHACVVDRAKMLKGERATEQCAIIDGVNFLNNADVEGKTLPPAGAPNIMIAAGGAQLKKVMEDDAVLVWTFHVDWTDPSKTKIAGPERIAVAPYRYLCDGQLTHCVPQPGTESRLDAQGDKIMQRLVYRRLGNQESIVAVHSVNTAAGAGGVRWYEFRVDTGGPKKERRVTLHQQGTYAPDNAYRWMASPAIDRRGNIAIGYSFGGTPHFAGQRFAARLASDPKGVLSLRETVLVEGEGVQNAMRWEDYTQTAIDPNDDCTIWYVGDYMKKGVTSYSSRIGAFRLPGCG
jgi:hypothetical protein